MVFVGGGDGEGIDHDPRSRPPITGAPMNEEPEGTPGAAGDDERDGTEKSGARGIAVSKLTAEDVGKPELADHEPAGEDPHR
jgi:hypothetical protein